MVKVEHPQWPRRDPGSIRIEDGLINAGAVDRYEQELQGIDGFYCPLQEKNLPTFLAKTKDERSAKHFVGRYGLLGFKAAFGGANRRKPKDEQGSVYARADDNADPLEWMLEQAGLVEFALRLTEKIQNPKTGEEAIRAFLEEHPQNRKCARVVPVWKALQDYKGRYQIPPGPTGVWLHTQISVTTGDSRPQAEPMQSERAKAWRLVADMVNVFTWFIRPRLEVFRLADAGSGIYEYLEINSLIEAIWWLVREEVLEASERYSSGLDEDPLIRICPCGNPFIATERGGREKYCPPPWGSNESLCGRKYRRLARMNLNEKGVRKH